MREGRVRMVEVKMMMVEGVVVKAMGRRRGRNCGCRRNRPWCWKKRSRNTALWIRWVKDNEVFIISITTKFRYTVSLSDFGVVWFGIRVYAMCYRKEDFVQIDFWPNNCGYCHFGWNCGQKWQDYEHLEAEITVAWHRTPNALHYGQNGSLSDAKWNIFFLKLRYSDMKLITLQPERWHKTKNLSAEIVVMLT